MLKPPHGDLRQHLVRHTSPGGYVLGAVRPLVSDLTAFPGRGLQLKLHVLLSGVEGLGTRSGL